MEHQGQVVECSLATGVENLELEIVLGRWLLSKELACWAIHQASCFRSFGSNSGENPSMQTRISCMCRLDLAVGWWILGTVNLAARFAFKFRSSIGGL